MNRIAIIDNNVLANFFDIERIDLLNKCRNIFEYILIPEEVKEEIEKYRKNNTIPSLRVNFLSKLNADYGFFRLCTTYDPITMMFLNTEKNIHKGEAEAIAQAFKRNIGILFTEDKACINYIEENYSYIRHYDTLFLIALLDLQGYLTFNEYKDVLKELKNIHGFNVVMLRIAFIKAYQFLGLPLNKKNISQKTSFSKIGLK